MKILANKKIIVTGATSGIGQAIAMRCAQAGADVAFCAHVEHGADVTTKAIEDAGQRAFFKLVDLTDLNATRRFAQEAIAALGGVDGVVDIVGIARFIELPDVTDDDWEWFFSMNLRHAFLAMQIGSRVMTDGGVFVFVTSASGLTSAPRHAPYGAAKAGLMSLVRTGAVELGPKGIRVNSVSPGVVWTPRVGGMLGDAGKASQSRNAPLGDVAYPSDIASGLLFFASDLSRFITGQTLSIDGGVSAKFPFDMDNV